MGRLKISSNLFLEVNELLRQQQFTSEAYKRLAKYLSRSYGIAQSDDNSFFKVTVKTGTNDCLIVNKGVAFDEEMNPIILEENIELSISSTETKQWVILERAVTNDERGTVNISSQGILTGTGTEFLSVLRGQPNYPTKVRFTSTNNTRDYEVSEVMSDRTAILTGDFVAENGLKYQVVGTFTPGFQPSEDDKLIYEYDYCKINVVESDSQPALSGSQMLLASVVFNREIPTVNDERINNIFNYSSGNNQSANAVNNPLVCLIKSRLTSKNLLDLWIEWGYKVNTTEIINTSTNVLINITGESHYIGAGSIPDDIFKGWLLYNRRNMTSMEIDGNDGSTLYISKYNSVVMEGEELDLVVVPNVKNIEFRISLTGTNYEGMPNVYQTFSIENHKTRLLIPVESLDTLVKMNYRFVNSDGTSDYKDFSITPFDNVRGEQETLVNSSFSVNMPEDIVVVRNYS